MLSTACAFFRRPPAVLELLLALLLLLLVLRLDVGGLRSAPIQQAAVCAASPPERPGGRFLLVLVSDCGDGGGGGGGPALLAAKPWLSDPSRAYSVVLQDWSAAGACSALAQDVDLVVHMPGRYKYDGLYELLLVRRPSLLARHDYFGLFDDDVDFPGGTDAINALFRAAAAGRYLMTQASLSARSAASHPVLRHTASTLAAGAIGRRVSFIEVMMPVMSREALRAFLPLFRGQTHAWGLDSVWSWSAPRLFPDDVVGEVGCGGGGGTLAVLDAVQADHLRPVSGNNTVYRRIGGMEVAWAEMWAALQDRLGVSREEAEQWKRNATRGIHPPPQLLYAPLDGGARVSAVAGNGPFDHGRHGGRHRHRLSRPRPP
jgi:hypothetical protein